MGAQAADAEVVKGAGHELGRQALSFEGGLDDGVREENRPVVARMGLGESGEFAVDADLVTLLLGVVPDVDRHDTPANVARAEVKKPRPSVPGPHRSSTACSGCGMRPTTFPRSLVIPAMSRNEPLGLTPT